MEPKRKRCKVCPTLFVPRNSLQVVCSWECGQKVAQSRELLRKVLFEADRAERRERRARKVELRTRSDWMELARVAFNRFIRERDNGQPCISCDTYGTDREAFNGGYWDAGHFRTVGAAPELRFNELNVHRQCKSCNSGVKRKGKSVRVVHDPERAMTIRAQYRERLIRRIGLENVEWLEGPHEPKHYTVDDLKEIIATYRAKLRALRKGERAAA